MAQACLDIMAMHIPAKHFVQVDIPKLLDNYVDSFVF